MIDINTSKVHLVDVIDGLKSLDDECMDIIIGDPPYNIGKDFGLCKDQMNMSEYIEWSKTWMTESLRVLKPNGTFYIYGFSEILAHLCVAANAEIKRWLIWHYSNKNVASSTFWQRSHESILLLAKNKPIFNIDDVREPYTETFLKNAAGKKRAGTKGRFSKNGEETTYNAHENGALPRDVIKIPALAGGAGRVERAYWCNDCDMFFLGTHKKEHESHDFISHPTQKPIALTRKLIAGAKNKSIKRNNALVLFSGSGAELVAAIQEQCNVIGFDINPSYAKMANHWVKQANDEIIFI